MNDHIYHIIYIRVRTMMKLMFALLALTCYLIITFLPIVAIVTALVAPMPEWSRVAIAGLGLLASVMGRPLTVLIISLKNI